MKISARLPIYARVLARMVYPEACAGCSVHLHSWENDVCENCRASFVPLKTPVCPYCGGELPPFAGRRICSGCSSKKPFMDRTWTLYSYNEAIKKILHLVKFRRRRKLLRIFKSAVQCFVKDTCNPSCDYVMPVPLDWNRQWDRGFNQSRVLAAYVREALGWPMTKNLIKWRATRPQSSLKREERLRNLWDSFRLRRPDRVPGRAILLVDDIYTTGSTVNECARLLKAAGARAVYAFTLARVPSDWN